MTQQGRPGAKPAALAWLKQSADAVATSRENHRSPRAGQRKPGTRDGTGNWLSINEVIHNGYTRAELARHQGKARKRKLRREPGQHHVTVTGSIAVRLDGMSLPRRREHRRLLLGEFQYKPQLTLILLHMGGGRWIMHHIMALFALGFLFAVLLGIV
jgi:hypothetical protein